MVDEKLQKVADRTVKVLGGLLRLPKIEAIQIRLVEENDVEGSVELSEDRHNLLITYRVSNEPLDMFYVIAHELRHLYQMMYERDKFFLNYSFEDMHSMNKYNMQPEEIDANAFSCALCELFFNVGCPPKDECSKEVMDKIAERAIEIATDYMQDSEFDYAMRRFQSNPIFEIYRSSALKYIHTDYTSF